MLGTIVNAAAIALGGIIGIFIKKGLSEKVCDTVMKGLGLCVFFIGICGLIENAAGIGSNKVVLIIISIAAGGAIGQAIDIDRRINNLGNKIEKSLKGKQGSISEGFVTASLLFCVGAMAVIGSLESGLTGVHNTLFAKAVIDGIISIILASALGIGVTFSAAAVFLYQGAITLAASALKNILTASVIADMTMVGSLLIIAVSINILKISQIKAANLLLAIFIPMIYYAVSLLF